MTHVLRESARGALSPALTLAVVTVLACGGEPRAEDVRAVDADAGPDAAPSAGSAEPPSPSSTWAYSCPDGRRFVAHYRDGEVILDLPERELRLPRITAASGARYQRGDTLFWDRGGQAILDIRDEWYRGCEGERAESPEDAARLLGFEFRGLGQEPGWLVDVDADRQVRWVGQYGTVRFATGAPEIVEQTEQRTVWRAVTDVHELTVEAVQEPCEDAMSGQSFTHTVTVVVDGEELHGCGSWHR
jgi:uncharacterized membrane protein/membrane-bound inhibitor of C-type lysozyme